MVIKKKRTYKKQKGGMKEIDRIMIPFFDLIKICIMEDYKNTNIVKLYQYIDEKMKYSLFVKLSLYLKEVIKFRNTRVMFSLQLVKYLLVEPEIRDKFIDKFLKLYIHLLFIRYLFVKDNELFKNAILTLLQQLNKNNKMIVSLLIMSNHLNSSPSLYIAQLEQKLRNLFLNDYSTEYGIPVFYGGLLFDSQYNEFVCRQVGASSNKKRNFIINPVLAFAYGLFYKLIIKEPEIKQILKIIDRLSKINQSITELSNKIHNYLTFHNLINILYIKKKKQYDITKLIKFVINKFISKPITVETKENSLRRWLMSSAQLSVEQKIRNKYDYLYSNIHVPKLLHINRNSQFCIAINEFGAEEIIQPSTFSKCALHYGCNLKMTAEIREENISSMTDILSLAQILLLIVLNYGDNIFMDISNIQDFVVNRYINLFYNKLEGRQINNRIILSKINTFDKDKIKKLVERLSILYKYFLIQKINILSRNQYANISQINLKLKMIIIELRNLNSLFNYFEYLHNFLSEEQDNICKNDSQFMINRKLYYFTQELDKIKSLIKKNKETNFSLYNNSITPE